MSWMAGVGPVKDVNVLGISRGLSEDWYSSDRIQKAYRKEFKTGDFWDVIDNPMYQVAAEAAGLDWAEWVKDAKSKVGTGPDDGLHRVRAVITPGRPGGTSNSGGPNPGTRTIHPIAAEYEWMTRDEAEARGLDYEAGKTTRWKNKETGDIITGHPSDWHPRTERGGSRTFWGDSPFSGMSESQLAARGVLMDRLLSRGRDEDDWEELRDWGSFDEDINEDLDDMSRWLTDIVNVNDHLHPIIREGPKGEHYGIEGDIWEHYGLDQEIEPPKELEWDSYDKKMQLATAVTSTEGYSTPEGITPVDLHGD